MTTRNDLAQRLIRHAARTAPPALAERLDEEWSADLAARTGTFARLRLAIGCWWALGVIARDFAVPQVATSGTSGGVRTLLGGLHYDFPRLSRRTLTFVTIAGLHVLLIYLFTSGLAQHVAQIVPQLTRGMILENSTPQRPLPPPPAIDVKPLTDRIDPQVLPPPSFEFPAQTTSGPEVKAGPEVIDTPAQPPPLLQRLPGGPGRGFPNTDDFYPAASRRLAETGATTVQVCVDSQGRLASDPVITQSSGIVRLDDGALKLARAGSGHYRPTTENGQPVSSCYPYRIRFRLE
jgi:TonB family protein